MTAGHRERPDLRGASERGHVRSAYRSTPQLCLPIPRFDGADVTDSDTRRLAPQLDRVRDLMADGEWRTLREISDAVGVPETSVSAHLRSLRKPRYGAHLVNRWHVGGGLYRYQVLLTDSGSDLVRRTGVRP